MIHRGSASSFLWIVIAIIFANTTFATTYQVFYPEMTIIYDDQNMQYVSIDYIQDATQPKKPLRSSSASSTTPKVYSYHFFHGDLKTGMRILNLSLTMRNLDTDAKSQATFVEQNLARYTPPELMVELAKEPNITNQYLLVVANIIKPQVAISIADFDAIVSHFAVDKLIALELIEKGTFASEVDFDALINRYMMDSNFDMGTIMKINRVKR